MLNPFSNEVIPHSELDPYFANGIGYDSFKNRFF
jgi:hypothetical protein